MNIVGLAKDVARQIGNSYHARAGYSFAVPDDGHVREAVIDAAVFSTPIPSIQTAAIGFKETSDEIRGKELSDLAYLGAGILIVAEKRRAVLYEYRGSPIAHKVDEIPGPPTSSASWMREKVIRAAESSQLSLGIESGRHVLLETTRLALSKQVDSLMKYAQKNGAADELEAFQVAIGVIRKKAFPSSRTTFSSARLSNLAKRIASTVSNSFSFANVPPESIAELYESLAVGTEAKRRKGIVYTPAWLARYVVDRLPMEAFARGHATDPTCGSGTFLVCFLERVIESRIRRGLKTPMRTLVASVTGIDKDPVAIEAARLALDFFAARLGIALTDKWDLQTKDATKTSIPGDWIIGNLPFGYRTHAGRSDISSVIIEKLDEDRIQRKGMSLILPDSLAYTTTAETARALLRSNYRIQEITRLPEQVFETSSAKTMVLMALGGGTSKEIVVREATHRDLQFLIRGRGVSQSYGSRFPARLTDPWRFTPFSNEIELAEKQGTRLAEFIEIRMGLQVYGAEEKVVMRGGRGGRRLLMDPRDFATWSPKKIRDLPFLNAEREEVRRAGPWEKFDIPKVIVRTTTTPNSHDRLAAIPDEQGVWFTDKFAGLWPTQSDKLGINALAAYFQTRFVRVWFDSNNPSRKLRISTLGEMPVPNLPPEWWKRASFLAGSGVVARPSESSSKLSLFSDPSKKKSEWKWLNAVVEAAFGLQGSTGEQLEDWLAEQEQNSQKSD